MEFRTQSPEKAISFAVAAVKACLPFSYCDIGKSYSFSVDCSSETFNKIFKAFLPEDVLTWSPKPGEDMYRHHMQCAQLQLMVEDVQSCQTWADIMSNSQDRAIQLTSIVTFYEGDYVEDFDWTAEEKEYVTLLRKKYQSFDSVNTKMSAD